MRRFPKDEEYSSKLKSLVFPIMLQSFMLALVSASDAIMLGFVDQQSLSSVSLAGQVQFIFNILISSITVGMGILTAQYYGKRDMQTIERIIPIALGTNFLLGAVFSLAAFFAPRLIMSFYTNVPELIARGGEYLKVVSPSYFLCAVSQIYLTAMKNTGHAKRSSSIASSAVVINIILNGVLIFGIFGAPKLGIVGAAWATVAARFCELAWAVVENRKPDFAKVRWGRLLNFDKVLFRDFWHYTTPALGAGLVWGVAYMLYSVIMGHLGSDAVAANSVTSIVRSLVSCLIRGVGGAAGIIVGNALGSGDLPKAKDYAGRLAILSACVGIGTGAVLIAISPIVVRFAPLSIGAAALLQQMLLFCGINVAFQSVNHVVLDGIFCAGGDSKFDMDTNLIAMWCFSVPAGFLAAFLLKWPAWVVYCIVNLDEIVKIPWVIKRYFKYIWLRDITR